MLLLFKCSSYLCPLDVQSSEIRFSISTLPDFRIVLIIFISFAKTNQVFHQSRKMIFSNVFFALQQFFYTLSVFLSLVLRYFHIDFYYFFFLYIFPLQIIFYIKFLLVLSNFLGCFHNVFQLFLYYLPDDNDFVLFIFIFFYSFTHKYCYDSCL